MDVNEIHVTGRLTADLSEDDISIHAQNNAEYLKFTLATAKKIYDKTTKKYDYSKADFIQCTIWGRQQVQYFLDHAVKGQKLYCKGKLSSYVIELDTGKQVIMTVIVDFVLYNETVGAIQPTTVNQKRTNSANKSEFETNEFENQGFEHKGFDL